MILKILVLYAVYLVMAVVAKLAGLLTVSYTLIVLFPFGALVGLGMVITIGSALCYLLCLYGNYEKSVINKT